MAYEISEARTPYLRIYIDGNELVEHHGAVITNSLDQACAEATIRAPVSLPSTVMKWSQVSIVMGASAATARQRFLGHVVDISTSLWPGEATVVCRGLLYKTKVTYYPGQTGITVQNLTDQVIVETVLEVSGLAAGQYDIQGTGTTMGTTIPTGDTRFTWGGDQSGYQLIEDLDRICYGFRTFDGPGGTVLRRKINVLPLTSAAASFYQGTDILEGTGQISIREPQNRVEAIGWGDIYYSVAVDNPSVGTNGTGTFTIRSPLIEDGAGITAQDTAEWWIAQRNNYLVKARFQTFRDDFLPLGATIYVESLRMGINQNFVLTGYQLEIDENNTLTTTITAVSQLGLGSYNRQVASQVLDSSTPLGTPLTPTSGVPELGVPSQGTPTAENSLQADFSVSLVEKERVIIGGVATTVYTFMAEDVSQASAGTITARAWALSGGTPRGPTTGDGQTFISGVETLSGATLSLEITDSNALTATVSKSLANGAGAPTKVRELFFAANAQAEALDPDSFAYNVQALSVGNATVVANGPAWSGGSQARVGRSDDYLATAPSESSPAWSGGATTTCLWIEPDVSETNVVAGSTGGEIATSSDSGATWTVKSGPTGSSVNKVIASRFVPGQIHLIDSTGYFVSDDSGTTWRTITTRASGYIDMDLSHSRNMFVTGSGAVVDIDGLGNETTQTGISGTPVAVTANIRDDKFWVLCSNGTTWVTTTSGGSAFSAATSIPSGTPQTRGMYRDGGIPGLIYYAAGTGGAWKTLDGFDSSAGFLQLRAQGVDGAHASGDWKQIGAGLLRSSAVSSPATAILWLGIQATDLTTDVGHILKIMSDGTFEDVTPAWLADPDCISPVPGNSLGLWVIGTNASGDKKLGKTLDGGDTWTDLSSLLDIGGGNEMKWPVVGLGSVATPTIAAVDDDSVILAHDGTVGPSAGLYRSDSGGAFGVITVAADAGISFSGGRGALWSFFGKLAYQGDVSGQKYHVTDTNGSNHVHAPVTGTGSPFGAPRSSSALSAALIFVEFGDGVTPTIYKWTTGATSLVQASPASESYDQVQTNGLTRVAIAGSSGFNLSDDSGATWLASPVSLSAFSPIGLATGRRIAFHPTDADTIYIYKHENTTILRSTDAGQTWAQWLSLGLTPSGGGVSNYGQLFQVGASQ